ncbi:MAG: VOC family protein [Solirubrobacteraceae bacterium]
MGRVVHFEIHAADCDRAERFYKRVFGWEIRRWDGAPVDYRLITTGAEGEPGINGAIVERRGEADGKDAVVAFVCTVDVDDIAATESAVKDAGGEQVVDRQTLEGVGSFSYFKDPEGNVFGAIQTA